MTGDGKQTAPRFEVETKENYDIDMVSTLAGKAGIAGKAGKWAFIQNLAGTAVQPYGFLLLWLEKLEF